jgi:hypothetical protein
VKFEEMLDPDLVTGFESLPEDRMAKIAENPAGVRESSKAMMADVAAILPSTEVKIDERTLSTTSGDVSVYLYQPLWMAHDPPCYGFTAVGTCLARAVMTSGASHSLSKQPAPSSRSIIAWHLNIPSRLVWKIAMLLCTG